jgi:hypothetical protein
VRERVRGRDFEKDRDGIGLFTLGNVRTYSTKSVTQSR